jgi:YD repeat-containing protein
VSGKRRPVRQDRLGLFFFLRLPNDYNGNAVTKNDASGITTYAWDYENHLTSVTLPGGGGTVSFAYDPFGRRIKKVSSAGTSVFAYDGDNLIEEPNSTGAVVARYSQGLNIDEPLAMLRSGANSFYNADGLGSITSLSNAAGALAQNVHLRFLRKANRFERFADKSIPVHRTRIGQRNRPILLPRQILRPNCGPVPQ